MKCEILILVDGEQEVAGTVDCSGKACTTEAKPGYEQLMKNVMLESHTINSEEVSARQDPKNWFKTLPQHYSGTYMRARFV